MPFAKGQPSQKLKIWRHGLISQFKVINKSTISKNSFETIFETVDLLKNMQNIEMSPGAPNDEYPDKEAPANNKETKGIEEKEEKEGKKEKTKETQEQPNPIINKLLKVKGEIPPEYSDYMGGGDRKRGELYTQNNEIYLETQVAVGHNGNKVLRIGFTADDINNGLYVEIDYSETEPIPVDAEKIKQLCGRKAQTENRLETIKNKLFGK